MLGLEVELIRRCLHLFFGEETQATLFLVFPVRVKWIGSILHPLTRLLLMLHQLADSLDLLNLLSNLFLEVLALLGGSKHVVFLAELLE